MGRRIAFILAGTALLIFGLTSYESWSAPSRRGGQESGAGFPLAARVEMTVGAVLILAGWLSRGRPSN